MKTRGSLSKKSITLKQTIHLQSNQTFQTLGSIIEKSNQGPVISLVPDVSMRDLLGFKANTVYKKNPPPNPVDILSFDNFVLKCDVAQGMIYRGKRSVQNPNLTTDVDPGYKYIEKFRCGVQWYRLEKK